MRECHCVVCTGREAGNGNWRVIDADAYVYTVGLWHAFGSPELAVFGLPPPDMAALAEAVAEEAQAGSVVVPDGAPVEVAGPGPVFPRPALARWHHRLFPEALRFYRGQPVPVVQLVWGDGAGRPPWADGCDADCRRAQPRLWDRAGAVPPPDGWAFAAAPDTLVMTTATVAYDAAPVTVVIHDEDGEWQFLDGDPEPAGVTFVHLAHVVAQAPGLVALADLPSGWEAARTAAGEWVREPLDDD